MDDYTLMVVKARARTYGMIKPNVVDDLADAVESLLAIEERLTDHVVQLAAERDALRAENADLKEDEQEALAERNAALKQRDALRAQLDGMTTEWAVRVTVPRLHWEERLRSREECERFIANQPLWYSHQVGERFTIVQRTEAGPWMEVE